MDNFKKQLKKEFLERFNVEIEYRQVEKLNDVLLESFTVKPEQGNVSPVIYIDGEFEKFKSGKSMEEIVNDLFNRFNQTEKNMDFNVKDIFSKEYLKENIFFQLISKKWNREFLEDVIYETVSNDLALVLRVNCSFEREQENGTILLKKSHLKFIGLEEDVLFNMAKENTPKIKKEEHMNIAQVIDIPMLPDIPMIVLSNTEKILGAGVILYEGVLKNIATEMKVEKIFIIPSSIHEVLLLPYEENKVAELVGLIQAVNMSEVMKEEWLSDRPYIYDSWSDTILFD